MINFIDAPSPNWRARAGEHNKGEDSADATPRFIVIHYTDTKNLAETFGILQDPQKKVSSHVVIDSDGKIYRLVADDKTAWHAGLSYWRGTRNLNPHSLGVELQHGGVRYPDKNGKLADYPIAQIESLMALLHHWRGKFSVPPENIVGHSDIAPDRKIDPGATFPWQRLVVENLAQDMAPHRNILTMADDKARDQLLAMGYDPMVDTATLKKAFGLRFTNR
ncbi:MAG: N-acetylmuramoyl-L-alanine amidase [Hydrotalea sp.]|nr:N-acetylmuramoyl-L-alanine amidase [Hydrotalea sp.]